MSEPKNEKQAKRVPAWERYFLRSLERTGDVRASAEEAGIDHSTAYARRRAHAGFAVAWDEALGVHAERVARERAAEMKDLAPPPASLVPLPTGLAGRGN